MSLASLSLQLALSLSLTLTHLFSLSLLGGGGSVRGRLRGGGREGVWVNAEALMSARARALTQAAYTFCCNTLKKRANKRRDPCAYLPVIRYRQSMKPPPPSLAAHWLRKEYRYATLPPLPLPHGARRMLVCARQYALMCAATLCMSMRVSVCVCVMAAACLLPRDCMCLLQHVCVCVCAYYVFNCKCVSLAV